MKYYKLQPEVAGQVGDESILEYKNGMISEVKFLEYSFFGWLGDELLTSHPCFIVTKELAVAMQASNLLGYTLQDMRVSLSEEFIDFYGNKKLPEFIRLIPAELYPDELFEPANDLYLSKRCDLIVSERALLILKKYKLNNCDIDEI